MDCQIYKLVKVRHLISALLAIPLVLANYLLLYPWYLNNLIAIALIATTVKIFKVT